MPKKIFYCVDFHCPAGGALGYDGGRGGRLGGRRRPGGYLRESDGEKAIGRQLLDAINSSEIAKNGIYIAYPGRRTAFTFTVDSFDSGVLTLTDAVNGNKKIQDFLRELRSVGVERISDITRIVTVDDKTVDGAWECSKINPPNSMGNIFIEMKKIPDNTDYKSEFGDLLRESDNGTPVSDILVAYKKLPEELKKDVEQIATGPDGVMVIKHKDGKFTVVEDGKSVMERVSADEVRKSGKLGKKQVTVVTKDEIGKLLSECDDADPEQMMKEFVEKKRKCGVEEDEYRRPKNQPHNLHQVDEGEDIEEDEDVEEDEYRRPKNQPHNLHQIDEKDAPTEYHNDFGSDLLACAKGMNDNDFNSAHVGVWSGFGFNAVVPTAFSGSHVTLEPSDDNMLTLPQFLNGLKKIGVKKLSDVKTLDIYGEDSEYAGFEWDRNPLMKVICLKFSSKEGDPDPKDTFKDFMSEEDSKNEFEGESEKPFELNESLVRFCDRLIRG